MKGYTKSFFSALCILLASLCYPLLGQEVTAPTQQDQEKTEIQGFGFEIVSSVDATDVKSQDNTGTCWSFATTSFMESELMRMGKGDFDLSEMFVVRNIYREKAFNFVQRKGKANFSEGALAHDFMNAVHRYGIVPEDVYSGRRDGTTHDHSEMAAILEGVLKVVVEQRRPSPRWREAFDRILDVYLGEAPEVFNHQGRSITPVEFARELGFAKDNYVNLTSFTHHPFYESFVLEIPDNFSNGSFYNLPIDELVATIDNAIENGYSVAWDGDVSERGFSANNGVAILPKSADAGRIFQEPTEEIAVTQEMRQETFEDHTTTDDHLMHLTGIARDKHGNKYYVIKNSWGSVGPHQGYLYMSEAFVRLKTISILVHKDAMVTTRALKPADAGWEVVPKHDSLK
ncbi:MAG TPA: C1 family peptidase [Pirellulaceae bacterium]|nr:C1 family peptidase [Pirellulaceae bacterium]HMO92077.1 C1 family peptidase [Pirellulaceae bacterium]HMP69335.1 C1 family peptidase [Pirellulaceae bacterium]